MATTMTAPVLSVHAGSVTPPDPEVPARARRRRFTVEYKLAILAETDAAPMGGVAAILRREGLYSSHLAMFRKQRDAGTLAGAPRGPKRNPLVAEVAKLRRENERLRREGEQVRPRDEVGDPQDQALRDRFGRSVPLERCCAMVGVRSATDGYGWSTKPCSFPQSTRSHVMRWITRITVSLVIAAGPLAVGAMPALAQPDCLGLSATIVGTSKDDDIQGTSSRDVIVALDGDDDIEGLDGDDVICGGSGNDRIDGGDGQDRIDGGFGRDAADGGRNDDVVRGSEGSDYLEGGKARTSWTAATSATASPEAQDETWSRAVRGTTTSAAAPATT